MRRLSGTKQLSGLPTNRTFKLSYTVIEPYVLRNRKMREVEKHGMIASFLSLSTRQPVRSKNARSLLTTVD